MKDTKKKAIAKAIIAAHIGYVWKIDADWLKENMVKIFDNEINGYNLSISGYEISNWANFEFIKLLYEKQLLLKILDAKEYTEASSIMIRNILVLFDGNKENIKIVKCVLQAESALEGIRLYADSLSKNPEIEKHENKINIVLVEAIKTNFKSKTNSEFAVVSLLRVYKKFADKTHIWKLIIHLSNNNSNYGIKEIIELLKQENISNDMQIEFVKKYVDNLNEHYFYIKEVVELVELPNWAGKIKEKRKIINKLGRINPHFYSLFNNES